MRGGRSAAERSLVWVDREGREEPINAPPRAYERPRLSPDGTRLAVDIADGERDIWLWDFARQTFTRLTFDPASDTFPVWTPDGQRLIFASLREDPSTLYWQAADGTGAVERLVEDQNPLAPYALSPDGARLVLGVGGGLVDIGMLSLQGDRRVESLLQSRFEEGNADISPDGRWIAYDSDETGRDGGVCATLPGRGGETLADLDGPGHRTNLGAQRARAVLLQPRRCDERSDAVRS